MSEYVDFHYMPLEGKITGKQVLKQTEDAINDLGNKVYSLDIDQSEIDEAIEKSNEAINTANSALAAVTTGRSVWFNNVAEMIASNIEAGVTAETKGYHVANDGGNALYLIRQEKSGDVVDGGSLIALDNGNMAELVTDGTVNVKQFGAIGNGTDDDTTVFQNTSSYAQTNGFVPFVGVATYKITGNVTGTFNSFGEVTITGGGSVDIINLQEVVSDVSDIRDEVIDETANAKAYSESAATSATNASNSASSASTTATQLMEYLETKETLTAPAVDATLSISGAAADAKVTGGIRKMLADSSVSGNSFSMLANTTHSSTIDQAYVDIPAGEEFFVWINVMPTKNSGVYAYYTDGTSEQIMASEAVANPHYADGRLKLITASKDIARIGVNIVTPASDTLCEFVILSKTAVPIIKDMLIGKDCYIYFASSFRPTFKTTLNSSNNITSVDVTFPNADLYVLSGYNNTRLLYTSDYKNQTYTVGNVHKLVYDWSDETIKVLTTTTEGGPYLLLLEVGGAVNGALASYYFASNSIMGDNQGKLQIYSPGNVYIEQDTTNLKVYIKTNAMYVRPLPSISHTWSQFLTEIGETGVTSPKGETNCLCLNDGKDLVFNIASKTFKIVARGSLSVEDIVVIAQVNGILYYIIPTLLNAGMNREYFDKLVNPKYMEYYSNQLKYWKNVDKNSDFTFLFFSDIHGGATNMNRIVEFANLTKTTLDCIINGGDTVENKLEDGLTWYNDAVDNCDVDILVCAGNHDEWTGSSLSPVAKIETYNALFAPMVLKVTGIVQPADASTNGDMYYYKDYASKIRVIVIDANDTTGINHFDSAQATWFANALEDARTNNLEVLCVNHSPYANGDGLVRDASLNWNTWRPYSSRGDAINIDEGALTAVDTFISNGGTFIGWITGHTHMDNILTNTNHPGQFMFSTATALFHAHSADGAGGATSNPVTSGQYDCFNFMGVDTTNHFLKWWRIGYSIDGGMKERSVFCYDYANKVIVSSR